MNKTCDYSENLLLIREYKSGNNKAKGLIVEHNTNLIRSIATRFEGRGQETEDLIEIGKIGLLKAIEGFDESLGYSFSTYAFPLITGEIKRFLRDDGIIKLSRETKKNASAILKAKQDYILRHGKEPKLSELSEICNLSYEKITEALDAARPVMYLQEKISGDSDTQLCDTIADEDKLEIITEKMALKQAVSSLSDFERNLIELRSFREFTQSETAKVLGVSQVTISRNEKTILLKLKNKLL